MHHAGVCVCVYVCVCVCVARFTTAQNEADYQPDYEDWAEAAAATSAGALAAGPLQALSLSAEEAAAVAGGGGGEDEEEEGPPAYRHEALVGQGIVRPMAHATEVQAQEALRAYQFDWDDEMVRGWVGWSRSGGGRVIICVSVSLADGWARPTSPRWPRTGLRTGHFSFQPLTVSFPLITFPRMTCFTV